MRKTLIMALCIAACVFTTLSFAACGKGNNGGNKHKHSFTVENVTDEYLCSAATCTEAAKYYYSCKCGEKGTETFAYGNALGHSFTNYVPDGNATHENDGTKTATCDRCDATDTILDVGTKLESKMSFKTLSVDGTNVYGKVGNSTEEFSFINEIEVEGIVKFVVSLDEYGMQQIATKKIPLKEGDNQVYVLEMVDGECKTTYAVTIRRRPVYDVTFNTNGGSEVESQQVEEDSCATMPDAPEKRGYTFDRWDYDFSTPITKDTTIDVNWNIITYKIDYNLNGGTFNGENPTTYTVEDEITLVNIPTKRGYDFANWDNGGKIEKGSIGDVTFNASYTPIVYKITYDCGSGTNSSLNPLEYTIESEKIVLNDAYYINADFIEWRQNGVKVTEITKGSIGDVTLTAVWDEYDVKLKESSNSYTVIGLNCDKTDIVIKSTYKGKKVTAIGARAFYNCSNLTSVALPDSVTTIGYQAFENCSGLTSINVGEGVVKIDGRAFYGCKGLTSVTIPDSVTIINDGAFYSCSKIKDIFIEDISAWCNIRGLECLMSYSSTNKNLYLKGELVVDLIIPDNVTEIPSYAFAYCRGITNITLGKSVTTIGDCAFKECSGFTSITIPNSVMSIGFSAFAYCSGLTSVTIPDNMTTINGSVFYNCSELVSVIWNAKNCVGGKPIFVKCSKLSDVTFGKDVKTIPSYIFAYCSGLTNVTIPDSVTSIGPGAFEDCDGITNIYINDLSAWCNIDRLDYLMNYGSSDKNLYLNGSVIKDLVIPNDVTKINYASFKGCSCLISVKIPDSVTTIGGEAFKDCSSIESITLPFIGASRTASNDGGVFGYIFGYTTTTSYETSIIGATRQYEGYDDWSKTYKYYHYFIPSSLKTVILSEGITMIKECSFINCSDITSVTIPESVTKIDYNAFNGCSGLVSVNIPDSLTEICSWAFANCSGLTNVTIGKGVTTIGETPFIDCSNLTSVTWNAENCTSAGYISSQNKYYTIFKNCSQIKDVTIGNNVKTIPSYLFYNCGEITSITIPNKVTTIGGSAFNGCSGLTSIDIPNSVTEIEWGAFANCVGLTSVIIPDNVTTIGDSAFKGCSSLESMTLPFIGASKTASNGYDQVFGYIFGFETSLNSDTTYQYGNSNKNYYYYIPSSLKTVILNDNLTTVSDNAFLNCNKLTNIIIGKSVTTIGKNGFKNCRGLTSIIWNAENCANVGTGSYAIFGNCSNICDITIGDNVKTIPKYAFDGCSGLTNVHINDLAAWCNISGANNLTSFGSNDKNLYLKGEFIKDLIIPDSVTTIGVGAFINFSSFTSVTMHNRITTIDNYAFQGCSGLTNITIPDSVTTIGYQAFENCSGFTRVVIPKGVISIGTSAFQNCSGLTNVVWNAENYTYAGLIFYPIFNNCAKLSNVTFGDNVKAIPSNAFYNCSSITRVTIENGVTTIGEDVFYNCSRLASIIVPDSVISIGNNAFLYTAWYNNQPAGLVYAGKVAYKYKGTMPNNTTLAIKDGTLGIASSAFVNCDKLISVTIPDSVISIGSLAFNGCTSLTSVTIGNGVTSIGAYVFTNCSNLTSVKFNKTENWTCYKEGNEETLTSISSADLANTSTAAEYFTSNYRAYYWKRSE